MEIYSTNRGAKMTKENYEKELLDFYYMFNDEPPTPKIFDEIGKVAERLFANVSKHEGIDHELRVMPKIAEVEESITYIKQSQNRIVIEGDEGYSDGYWTMIIYDPLGDEKFKYTITDQASDNDYSFADFLIEAIAKYKESNFSA